MVYPSVLADAGRAGLIQGVAGALGAWRAPLRHARNQERLEASLKMLNRTR